MRRTWRRTGTRQQPLELSQPHPSPSVVPGTRAPGRQKTSAQALVEFAVIIPLLTLFLALSADFGRAFTAYIAISGAAREGAAFGMMSTADAADVDGITAAALAEASTIWGEAPTVTVPGCTDPEGAAYRCVRVTVSYTFEPIISFPPIPGSIDMTRTVQMRVLQ